MLARSFEKVIGVEANPVAISSLRSAFARIDKHGRQHTAVEATALDYLRKAVMQRERPSLIVLDPPRAGAGIEACELLVHLAPREIVYVSCDPATLARDLAVLQTRYELAAVHLVDLFPQTAHLETVVVLQRNS